MSLLRDLPGAGGDPAQRRKKKPKKKHHHKPRPVPTAPPAPPTATAPPSAPPTGTTTAPPPAGPPAAATPGTTELTGNSATPLVLVPAARHLARRFSWGVTSALTAEMGTAGSARQWFANQLDPGSIADPAGDAMASWFPSLAQKPEEIFAANKANTPGLRSWEVMADLSRWTVSRRIHSTRQVHETMVDFWSNLLHVPLGADDPSFWRLDYDKVIRAKALTSFEQLLQAAITHPAMGLNLNNAVSNKTNPNENLGRELLELHTVGVGNYTEDDVKQSALMLTGYKVDLWWPKFQAYYESKWHYTGAITVMGFTDANASADGQAATMRYLSYLAKHPVTAKRIARRLAVRFVRDDPSDALVAAVAKAYLDNDTAIKPTLMALIDHPDFATAGGLKVRMPMEDYIASVRGLGYQLQQPTEDASFANAMHWQLQSLGQVPYDWAAPNGFPEVNAAWVSAGRLLNSFKAHRDLGAQWWPTKGAVLPDPKTRLPALPATLQQVVDHVGLQVLGQLPGAAISNGIAKLLNTSLSASVPAKKADDYWFARSILSCLLDSPLHLHR